VEGGEGGKEGIKGKGRGREGELVPPHTICLRHAPASIAAAEKRPFRYHTPQSAHMVRNCGAQTLPLTMHYGGKKLGENRGPQRKGTYFWGSGLWCKVSSKLSENCNRKRGDRQTERQTDRHTDAGEFIICLMLCYSNGTHNKQCRIKVGAIDAAALGPFVK